MKDRVQGMDIILILLNAEKVEEPYLCGNGYVYINGSAILVSMLPSFHPCFFHLLLLCLWCIFIRYSEFEFSKTNLIFFTCFLTLQILPYFLCWRLAKVPKVMAVVFVRSNIIPSLSTINSSFKQESTEKKLSPDSYAVT